MGSLHFPVQSSWESNEKIEINADQFTYDKENTRIYATGNVEIIDQEFKDPAYVNELLRCNYNEGFNYGTFRVAIDKFANEINNLKIAYEVIYYQTDSSPGSFIWINNFYSKDFSDVISTNWINNPEANEIKNEFEENASCIDAKMYDAFLIT